MIDCETTIFNSLYTTLRTTYANLNIKSEYVDEVANFPCVMAVQVDNYPIKSDISVIEKKSHIVWQIDVFAKGDARKTNAKAIISLADTAMADMGFTRIMLQPTPNYARDVYRYTARYEAIVGATPTSFELYRV